jgi:microcystin-dependent protein
MPTPSARLGIPNYTETDTPVDIPAAWIARTAILDTLVPISQSTLAQRPVSSPSTAGIVGRQATITGEVDSPRLDVDLGNGWFTVGPPIKDGDPTIPGSRSLGTNAGQAAPGNSTSLFMPGDLKMSAAVNPSPGWLLCDGSAVSRSNFAALWAAIGSSFGTGDGSTTFNLPDYRGRTIVGAGAGGGLTNRAMGAKGGEENHLLVPVESGINGNGYTGTVSSDHSHSFNVNTGVDSPDHAHGDSGHAHGGYGRADINTGNTGNWIAVTAWGGSGGGTFAASAAIGGATARHAHNVSGNTGGISANHNHSFVARNADAAHNNMQPYTVANVFIKT